MQSIGISQLDRGGHAECGGLETEMTEYDGLVDALVYSGGGGGVMAGGIGLDGGACLLEEFFFVCEWRCIVVGRTVGMFGRW